MRTDTAVENEVVTLRLSGWTNSRRLEDVRNEMRPRGSKIVLDLEQVTLVDIGVVRFLKLAERHGVQLRKCPSFVREWTARE
jgi:hypothetical protein